MRQVWLLGLNQAETSYKVMLEAGFSLDSSLSALLAFGSGPLAMRFGAYFTAGYTDLITC